MLRVFWETSDSYLTSIFLSWCRNRVIFLVSQSTRSFLLLDLFFTLSPSQISRARSIRLHVHRNLVYAWNFLFLPPSFFSSYGAEEINFFHLVEATGEKILLIHFPRISSAWLRDPDVVLQQEPQKAVTFVFPLHLLLFHLFHESSRFIRVSRTFSMQTRYD